MDTDTGLPLDEFVLRERTKAWIYTGVELEIEHEKLRMENAELEPDHPDIAWNKRRMAVIHHQVGYVNHKLDQLTGKK